MAHLTTSLLLLALRVPMPLLAANFPSSVVYVLDGDTIEVLHNNRAEHICVNGIDCLALALIPVSLFDYGRTLNHHSCRAVQVDVDRRLNPAGSTTCLHQVSDHRLVDQPSNLCN